ncbi:purine-nucleoside phosphorylase [Candidatus Laterigemmans baculatus]|uniref:purine-nucleoside phosphorylase n=1 Tax=Candidatus Laterigemmans baculatus TaxID=2770505 RepID=UPI00193C1770|nr:purine-nucleoside phosphorylase [Candidatus Laterigemmans baculatus]
MMIDCRITEAAAAIRARIGDRIPRAAVILGSGLGGFAAAIENSRSVPFTAIPHFACSTAAGHRGEIVAGEFGAQRTPIVAMAGRLHCYEGWSLDQVTFPVAVLAALGAEVLIVSNAAGGLHADFCVGDIMVLRDHINLLPGSRGDGRPGVAAVDACGYRPRTARADAVYDPELARVALDAAEQGAFAAYHGTYLATLGPNYETRAEYRMMRHFGADAVGMSTVPEVLEASRRGMRVLALSMISNLAFPKNWADPTAPQPTDHEHVLEAGERAEPKLRRIIEEVLHATQAARTLVQ